MQEATDPLRIYFRAIEAIFAWAKAGGFRAVLIGGVASSVIGRPRMTGDVDLLAAIHDGDLERQLAIAAEFGIQPQISDPIAFAIDKRVLLLRFPALALGIDVSLAQLPFEWELIDRAQTQEVQGIFVALPTPEDLLVMKLLAGRHRDMDDAEGILRRHSRCDLSRVRYWLGNFAEILEMPEIVGRLDETLRRAGHA